MLRITGSVLLIIFKSLISLCFITCLIRISLNLKNDHDPLNIFSKKIGDTSYTWHLTA